MNRDNTGDDRAGGCEDHFDDQRGGGGGGAPERAFVECGGSGSLALRIRRYSRQRLGLDEA
jgi:hypothetical protein